MENKYIDMVEENVLHTYNRFNVVLEKGDGVYLYDVNDKKYLDFASGIGVYALGYNNKELNDALKEQIDKILHVSNLFYTRPLANASKELIELTDMDKVFFTNSGAEAIEGAIKIARKYGKLKDNTTDHEIIAMEHSFHGRTMGALAVTGKAAYREPFEPMITGVRFAKLNDINSVKKLINNKTSAILFECVQGEGGVYPATKEFVQGIRKLCDENDILMICDEIQCGMGRTGKMFAYENYDVKPDIITVAKALGQGVPVGAFIMNEKASKVLVAGDHGTTYGGNPFVTSAVSKVLDMFSKYDILGNVQNVSAYLEECLDKLCSKYQCIEGHRGLGLMQGLVFNKPVSDIVSKCIEAGLIVISAGPNVIRMLPPLIITKDNIDEMITILEKVLSL